MPALSQEIKALQTEVNEIEALFTAGNAFQEAAQKLKGKGKLYVQLKTTLEFQKIRSKLYLIV